jgi:type IV pilus assembly protein PilY1
MIYTGGNDGMLHAFNGGIWDSVNRQFHTQRYNEGSSTYNVGQAHELGAEMWAYVPMNLLPHLQWLKQTSYPHVYYMDAPPQSFDVNIFPDDDTHPNGWGTILVAGMRLGGGDFPVDLDGNGSTETTMSSSYVIFDITDPEKAPELIAEITAADMGFTTSMPTLIKSRIPAAGGNFSGSWFSALAPIR